MPVRSLVWFRGKDLRVSDHRPLVTAAHEGEVIPLFVLDPYFFAKERAARLPHRMQFLLESLRSLEQNLAHLGSRLVVVAGRSVDVVPALAKEWRVDCVLAHRWVEPFARERDRRIAEALHVPFVLFEGETLLPPDTLRTGGGTPYLVFTPFSRAFQEHADEVGAPLPAPKQLPALPPDVAGASTVPVPTLESLGIAKNARLIEGGEKVGKRRLQAFVVGPAPEYPAERDRMDHEGTSRLSADLKFGTVSVRAVWDALRKSEAETIGAAPLSVFRKQLLWREFAHVTLFHRPDLLKVPFRSDFAGFPWSDSDADFEIWKTGHTGYPVVDAAARQLLAEGFVHNRARMIAASFLAKDLMIDFRRGEAHYMELLVDGDWANNNMGWQWSAGTGCDAQPYFRVFNPQLQGEKFDPEGDYVRKWVPELGRLPAKYIHRPWEAPRAVLEKAGVVLGSTYPPPVIDHGVARDRFLKIAAEHRGRLGPIPPAT